MTVSMKAGLCLVILALSCTGCGGNANFDAHEKHRRDRLAILNEMTAILEGIKDEASAAAAKPKLEPLPAKMKALADQRYKLTNLKPDEMAALKEKLEKEEKEHFDRYSKAYQNIHLNNKILSEIHPLIDNINQADPGW